MHHAVCHVADAASALIRRGAGDATASRAGRGRRPRPSGPRACRSDRAGGGAVPHQVRPRIALRPLPAIVMSPLGSRGPQPGQVVERRPKARALQRSRPRARGGRRPTRRRRARCGRTSATGRGLRPRGGEDRRRLGAPGDRDDAGRWGAPQRPACSTRVTASRPSLGGELSLRHRGGRRGTHVVEVTSLISIRSGTAEVSAPTTRTS